MSGLTGKDLRNRNVRCSGRSVIRDDHNTPILDKDGARRYKPCKNWAANGTKWCQKHGGQFPSTIAAAQRRLQHGTDDLVEILERIARNENETASDRIKAINSYLDRAGIRAGAVISVEAPRWQQMLGEMFGQSTQDDEPAEPESEAEPAPPPPVKRARKAAPPPAAAPVAPRFEGW